MEETAVRQIWKAEAHAEDGWAPVYDDIYDTWQPCYRLYKESVAKLVLAAWKQRPGRVLEVGCGTGAVLHSLAGRIPERLLAGVDISSAMIEQARCKLPEADLRVSPFEQLAANGAAEPFQVIYFCGSLHHMPDHALVARTLDALTVAGSRIIVCEPNENWVFQRVWKNRIRRLLSPRWIWLRLINHAHIRRIQQTVNPLSEPAFHQHVDAAAVEEIFRGRFQLKTRRTDFAYTRLFEGVVTATQPATLEWLRERDASAQRRHPEGGGSLEMVFVKP